MSGMIRLHRDLAATGIVAVLAMTEAAQVFTGMSLLGHPVTWGRSFAATSPSWLVLLLLVLPLLRLLDRSGGGFSGRRLGLLSLGGVVFTALHLSGSALLFEAVHASGPGFRAHVYELGTVYFVPDLLTWVAIVTLHDVMRRYRQERAGELAAARHQASVADARYRVLRGQLRPDFFFNTLNAVAGLVVRGESARSVDALSALSELLRASLTVKPGMEAALCDELELVGAYLSIQELRFPDRLHAALRTESGTGSCRVPALLLVRLAESVVDGGLTAGSPFEVSVQVGRAAGRLEIRLSHTVPGLRFDLDGPGGILRRFDSRGRLEARPDDGAIVLNLEARCGRKRVEVP